MSISNRSLSTLIYASTLVSLVLVSGCTTDGQASTMGGGGADSDYAPWYDIRIGEYTVSIPAEAEVTRTIRPRREIDSGISPSPTWRSRVVHPGSHVIRMPHRAGYLAFYAEGNAGYVPDYNPCLALLHSDMKGCPPEGTVNGILATETVGSDANGTYHRTIKYDAVGITRPAGLVGHYEGAAHANRQTFDRILESVRR